MNVGAVAVAECASRLERAGKDCSFEDVDRPLEDLTDALLRTLAELHPRTGSSPSGA